MGVTAGAVVALGLVFMLLLDAKEDNGILQQGIESAAGVNARQAMVLAEVQANRESLDLQLAAEQVRIQAATDALEASRKGLVVAQQNFDRRLKAALEEMADSKLECASEFVPQPLIDALSDPTPVLTGPD